MCSHPRRAGLQQCSQTHGTPHNRRAGHIQGTTHKTLKHFPQHVDQIMPQHHAYKMAGHTHVFLEIPRPESFLKTGTDHSYKALWVVEASRTDSRHVPLMFRLGLTLPSAAPPVLCPATAVELSQVQGRTETGTGIVIGTDRYRLPPLLLHRSLSPCTKLWRSHC